ncbi:hypothetical protein [Longimicrobium sp.]|uniref:hypothetical protein n=1 Tax=Longimicrobium sp. TaxID=2029185 RepID=UPI003B3B748E
METRAEPEGWTAHPSTDAAGRAGGEGRRKLPKARWVAAWALLAVAGPASPAAAEDGRGGYPGLRTEPFSVRGTRTVTQTWNGAPLVLQVLDNARMPQTPAGSVVFAYLNVARQNNLGELALASGGDSVEYRFAPALATQPEAVVRNWGSNNLSVTNVSANDSTPIRIQAIGPGMPGTTPLALPQNTPVTLAPGAAAQGPTGTRAMQLVVRAPGEDRSVVAVIGGPADASGNNAYVIAVNAEAITGPPGSGNPPPPPGYYATTTSSGFSMDLQWGGSSVFVANLSSSVSPALSVILRRK